MVAEIQNVPNPAVPEPDGATPFCFGRKIGVDEVAARANRRLTSVIAAAKAHPASSKRTIISLVKGSRSDVLATIERAVAQGMLISTPNGKAHVISIAPFLR